MNPLIRGGLVALVIALAAGLAVAGLMVSDTSDDVTLPEEIERIVPSAESIIRPQGTVGVDLVDTHTGVLVIDGTELTSDQVRQVDALGQIFYEPATGQVIERFEAGAHSAQVLFWSKDRTRAEAESFTWRFRVG